MSAQEENPQDIHIQQHLEALEARKAAPPAEAQQAAPKAVILTTHALQADETLSHLSLKYYGHATEPYWRLIYEANKEAIGDNPNHVHVGTVLNIPVLPEGMKK
jgi:nucleoid-associated protein YgaU